MSVQRSRRASRPTTPLRRSVSRHGNSQSLSASVITAFPLEALKPQLSELADSLADLDTNFQYLDIMHENIARFSESFAAFLYGLEVNAWCVDFQEAPTSDSFNRFAEQEQLLHQQQEGLTEAKEYTLSHEEETNNEASDITNPNNTSSRQLGAKNSRPQSRVPTANSTKSRLATTGRLARSIPTGLRPR
ncbi:DASH complex subunit DAM1, partial [Lipomyces japonicus]|uniref:DASH complex subunit DAM1 n=1 Tax=Lipomyces japonicus TaxID=56871 RepID=UPI0034CF2B6E